MKQSRAAKHAPDGSGIPPGPSADRADPTEPLYRLIAEMAEEAADRRRSAAWRSRDAEREKLPRQEPRDGEDRERQRKHHRPRRTV